MGKNDSKTATELINLIRDIVTDELNKRDNTCVCQVIACNKDDTYNIAVIPDTKNVVTNVKSLALEKIKEGDYVYVYKFQNKLNNSIILARSGANSRDIRFVTTDDFTATMASISYEPGMTAVSWGEIIGTLSDQTDLQNALNNKQNKLPTTSTAGKVLTSTSTAGVMVWGDIPPTGVVDVQINGTTIVVSGVANFTTQTAYNASTNPIATVSDIPDQYLKTATTNGNTLTLTKQDNTTVVYTPTFTDNDHYPTSFSWTNGTTAGPTGSLTGNSGFSAVSFPAIPAATALQSGVVTTGNQNFKGVKNFPDGIKTGLLRLYDGYNDDYSDIQSGDCTLEITPSGGDTTYVMTDYGSIEINNSNGTIRLNFLPSSGTNATINMPSSSGTLALTSDIQNVELVDLTGVN